MRLDLPAECAESLPEAHTGDLFCDVESEAFQSECRALLFAGLWNRWVLWRSLDDDPTREEAVETTKAFLARVLGGNADSVEFSVGPSTPAGAVPSGWAPERWGSDEQIQSALVSCPGWFPVMRLRSGAYLPISVRFVYRGEQPTIPWPARRVVALGMGVDGCPTDADYLLASVYQPVANEEVPAPDPESSLDRYTGLPELKGFGLGDVAGDVGTSIAKATWPLLLGAGLVALIVALK